MKIMVLSVIVPDNRPGMQRMLQRELENIDHEVIFDTWRSGLTQARGDFVLLLERDSGITRGGVAELLQHFLDNPSFRKLAMVSPQTEFDDSERKEIPKNCYLSLTRLAVVPGSIVRRTSLVQHSEGLEGDILQSSGDISLAFWESGLRVMKTPAVIYFSPSVGHQPVSLSPSPAVVQLWQREAIA